MNRKSCNDITKQVVVTLATHKMLGLIRIKVKNKGLPISKGELSNGAIASRAIADLKKKIDNGGNFQD